MRPPRPLPWKGAPPREILFRGGAPRRGGRGGEPWRGGGGCRLPRCRSCRGQLVLQARSAYRVCLVTEAPCWRAPRPGFGDEGAAPGRGRAGVHDRAAKGPRHKTAPGWWARGRAVARNEPRAAARPPGSPVGLRAIPSHGSRFSWPGLAWRQLAPGVRGAQPPAGRPGGAGGEAPCRSPPVVLRCHGFLYRCFDVVLYVMGPRFWWW